MKNVTYVSAGAGSGKTYYLTDKLSSILGEGKVKGENILMTTFTELAAGELKRKAKAKLYSRGQIKQAEEVDLATIGTIHSVATSFLEKYWYLLGHSPKMNVLSDEDKNFFFSQSLSEILTEEDVSFLSDVAETLEIPIPGINIGVNKEFWKDHLNAIVDIARLYSIDSLSDSLNESLSFTAKMRKEECVINTEKSFVAREFESFKRFFPTLRTNLQTEERKGLIDEAERKIKYSSDYINLKDIIWFKNTFIKKFNLKDCKEFFADSAFFSSLDDLSVSSNYWDYIDEYIKRMFTVAEKWRDGYLSYKKQMKVIDFDDMERYFLALLDIREVQEDIKSRYKVVFVDEYQDCSPLQVKMFDKISELVERSYWVGDLKQAIYGFRGTDTNLVQSVVSKVEEADGSGRETLEYSWRSNKNLVEFANHAFTRAFSSTLDEEDVVLKHVKDEEGTLSILDAGNEEDVNEAMARYILSLIRNGEKPSSIAVLFRTNSEGDGLALSLKKYGIEVNKDRSVDITNPLLELVVSILSLVLDSQDRLSKAKIARLSQRGATTSAIIDGILSSSDDSYLDSIPLVMKTMSMSDRIKDYSVSKIVESLIIELNLYDKAKEMGNVEASKEILDSILEASKEYERHALSMSLPATLSGFIIEMSKKEGITIPGNREGVNILTMHKSKGLEWKTVIIGSLSFDECTDKRTLQEYFSVNVVSSSEDESKNVIRVLPWVFGRARSNFLPEIVDRIPENELNALREKRVEEIKRLMYVAVTRAKENLCFVIEGREPFKWFYNIGLTPNLDYGEEEYIDCFHSGDYFSIFTSPLSEERVEENNENLVLKVREDNVFYDKKDIQPSSMPPLSSVKVNMEKDFSTRIQVASNVDSALIGTAIHDVFCVLEKKKDPSFISSIISDHGFSKEIPESEEVLLSWENLERYLKEVYGEACDILHECPFTFEEDGYSYNGSIDLVWETKDGVVLIDYKTFPGSKKSILTPEDSHYAGKYSGQFYCYKKALEKSGRKVLKSYVYYPVAGCLVSIEF